MPDPNSPPPKQPTGIDQSLAADLVSRLMESLQNGRETYELAASRTDEVYLRQLFHQMISVRDAALARLSPFAPVMDGSRGSDGPASDGLLETAERVWTDLKAALGDADDVFIDALIDTETTTLETVKEVHDELPEGAAKQVVAQLRAECAAALADLRAARERPLPDPSE